MLDLSGKTAENLIKIRKNKPLIHNITNFVVMNSTANALLALGASPVMAHAENEVEEMVAFAGALVLNIGTLTDKWVDSMLIAGKKATALGKPIILDPVGAGATGLRTAAAKRILAETRISVVRGNASEILALGADIAGTRGVDASHGVDAAEPAARQLAAQLRTVVAITGPVDLVTDGKRLVRIGGGHSLMPLVTGTGCAATAVIGAFLAVDEDAFSAAASGLAIMAIAGEEAGDAAAGPGSFMVHFLDALYLLDPEKVAERCRFTVSSPE
jgi:hydroxyethylthiazole kinase